ncbi:MAG TPA: hypothetical protein VFW96_04565 [Thermomicrobiales bacterium]|nr:hypothetical protein [Thermomicrobiales bacterium]
MDPLEQLVATVLYEGYVLWPYRRSATKNRQRWTFGVVAPRAYSEASGGADPWLMQTECLVAGAAPAVAVEVRFLHVVERRVARVTADGGREFVDALAVGDERHLAWDEAAERAVALDALPLASLSTPRRAPLAVPAGDAEEPLRAPDGEVAGALVRGWRALAGTVEVGATALGADLWRLTVRIANTTPWHGLEREETLRQSLIAAHTILRATAGAFVSLLDPPEELREAAAGCENVKTWPVLVGEEGARDTTLSSPIILYDYPRIAPESPGDLFDGTEIDQLLLLNVLTLTDEEKAEMRATDPRARAILERSEALTADDFMGLHGAIREFRMLREVPEPDFFAGLEERPAPASVAVGGATIAPGSRVRLRPRAGGDIMDLALAGRVAVVEAIEQDYEERVHLAVTLEDDPGRDLGLARQPGHRFFFTPDEVEPLDGAAEGG